MPVTPGILRSAGAVRPARPPSGAGVQGAQPMANTGGAVSGTAPAPSAAANPWAANTPQQGSAPNAGAMPYSSNVSNMGTMPESKPNAGAMPYSSNISNMGMMPESKPNAGAMPYSSNISNMGMMPESKPSAGAMAETAQKQPAVSGAQASNLASETASCDYKSGTLPSCAPLAAGFVPFQQMNPPKYQAGEALTRGTLFPGLDLPFMNVANGTNPYAGTPLGELMALGFVIKELNLYLDTHPNDREAFEMLKSLNRLMHEGRERYTAMYGPQEISDITSGAEYTWLNDPWPWEYRERGAV